MSDPALAHRKFVDIVRAADSDQIVEVRVDPKTIHVVFRQGDNDVVWTNSDEIRQIASHPAKPSGTVSASQINIDQLIISAQHEGPCQSSESAEIRVRATFSGDLMMTNSCVKQQNPWPRIRKVTLADQEITEIDLYSQQGIAALLDEADKLLPDGTITQIKVTAESGARSADSTANTSPSAELSAPADNESLRPTPSAKPTASHHTDSTKRPQPATAVVAGVAMSIGGKECHPAFTRAERLGPDSDVVTGIDMYSCLKPSELRPFKTAKVSPSDVYRALRKATEELGADTSQIKSWTLSRLDGDQHQLVVTAVDQHTSISVDLNGTVVTHP